MSNSASPRCKVCENGFSSSGERVPRLLLCGHTLCTSCLSRLLSSEDNGTSSNNIICPFDRSSTFVPPAGVAELNKNFSLLEVLDSSQIEGRGNASNCTVDSNFSSARLRAHSESVVSPQLSPNSVAINRKCDENELHVATLYCLTCATNLCQQCSEIIHSTNTLSKHKRIPICEAPTRQRPQCRLHPGHPVELVCLEPACQIPTSIPPNSSTQSSSSQMISQFQLPMMCYLCRDFSSHKGHKFNLLIHEADSIKSLLTSCLNIINNFSDDVTIYIRKLNACMQLIEGTSTRSPSSTGSSMSVLGSDLNANAAGVTTGPNGQLTNVRGTALVARQQVHDYFEDLRHNLRRQEEVALSVVNTYVREKKLALQQSMQTLTMILSQLTSTETDLKRQSTLGDVDLIVRRSEISRLVDAAQWQQSQLQELLSSGGSSSSNSYGTSGSNGANSGGGNGAVVNVSSCDPSVPITFTRDNRVHIGPKIEMRLVMLGLNNAGKTSILFKLKQNEFVPTTLPTIGFNVETVEYKNLQFNIWDVGGDPKLRPLWKHYYLNTQALIFVVDSSDQSRLSEAQSELSRLMLEKDLRSAILLVLASKQDSRDAIGVEILTNELNLHKICCGRKWHIQACDAQTGVGLEDGLDWLSRQLVWAGVVDVCPQAPTTSSAIEAGPSNARSLNQDASSRYAIQHTSLSANQNAAFTNQEDSFTHRGGMHLYRNSSNSQFTRGAPDSGQDQRRVLGSGDQVGVQPHAGGGGDLASAASQSQVYYSSMATTDLLRRGGNQVTFNFQDQDYDLNSRRWVTGDPLVQLEYSSLIGRGHNQSQQQYNQNMNLNSN
ncbi:E3 ubiquitin-protein ligase TRIM23-like [Symsagittifera roscoffensis]|uniref:E3 ubiquitin-protein ligase TRIM23-like n=1 Tax=Symsagittifera roscoffensis TaxID=84072 RepID=UPI00307BED1A